MSFAIGKVVFRSPFDIRHPGDDIEVRQKENMVIATLRKTVEGQRQVIVQLEHKVEDLGKQNEEMRKYKYISTEEQETFKNQSKYIMQLEDERNQLALWLRKNKAQEIGQGKHSGIELIPLILKYLGGAMPDPTIPLVPTPTPEEGQIQ